MNTREVFAAACFTPQLWILRMEFNIAQFSTIDGKNKKELQG
jgi:hypothetical protein